MRSFAVLFLTLSVSAALHAEIQLIGVLAVNGRLLLALRNSGEDLHQRWVEVGATFEGYKVEGYDSATEVASLRNKDGVVEATLVKPRVAAAPGADDPRTMMDAELQALDLYRMKAGDTLAKVARLHGISIPNLAVWNQITDPAKMKVGDILFVTPPAPNQSPQPTQASGPRG